MKQRFKGIVEKRFKAWFKSQHDNWIFYFFFCSIAPSDIFHVYPNTNRFFRRAGKDTNPDSCAHPLRFEAVAFTSTPFNKVKHLLLLFHLLHLGSISELKLRVPVGKETEINRVPV